MLDAYDCDCGSSHPAGWNCPNEGVMDAEREACAQLVERITMQEMLLAGGEMTAGEKRTLRAFQTWIANKIRTRKER